MLAVRFVLMTGEAEFAKEGPWAYHTSAGAASAENPGPTDAALREAIAKALERLPAEKRVAFEHKVLNGRTLDETSRLEKISLNTAASRLRYALGKIRGQLRP